MESEQKIVVLMADDDEADIYTTRRVLNRAGLQVRFRSVPNGNALLAYLRREGRYADERCAPWPHVILLDINMPRMSGFEALCEIRADPSTASIPVVMLTTSTDQRDVDKSYSLGANAFISKPLSRGELERAIPNLCG